MKIKWHGLLKSKCYETNAGITRADILILRQELLKGKDPGNTDNAWIECSDIIMSILKFVLFEI